MQPLRVKKSSIPTVVDSMPSSNVLSTSQLKSEQMKSIKLGTKVKNWDCFSIFKGFNVGLNYPR